VKLQVSLCQENVAHFLLGRLEKSIVLAEPNIDDYDRIVCHDALVFLFLVFNPRAYPMGGAKVVELAWVPFCVCRGLAVSTKAQPRKSEA
jgi:hypothetical protein